MRIDILVFDGVDELDALGPLEVFRNAAESVSLAAHLVTPEPQLEVTGAHGLRFRPDGTFTSGADVLLVPGGGWQSRSPQGAWAEVRRGVVPTLIADARPTTTTVAGVCTGTMLLAQAGIIGDRPAATHHGAHAELAATGADVRRDRIVDDGDLVTCGGGTSGIDLALWLVEREFSREVADAVAAGMEYPRWRPGDPQSARPDPGPPIST